ncbi:unnamed protein product [Scytosiphon promiscuus]
MDGVTKGADGGNIKSSRVLKCQEGCDRLYRWGKDNHGINFSGVLLVVALILEVSATLWAFYQAVNAGALYGDVQCDVGSKLEVIYITEATRQQCTQLSVFETALLEGGPDYTFGCELDFLSVPAEADGFESQCSCSSALGAYDGNCSWANITYTGSDELDDGCAAIPLDSDNPVAQNDSWSDKFGTSSCWAKNPAGTAKLTVTATSVALVSQVVEAVVARKYFQDSSRGPHLMVAASVFEAVGVLAVSVVLVTLPSFGSSGDLHVDQQILFGLAIASGMAATLGALAEAASGYLKLKLKRESRSSWETVLLRMLQRETARDHRIYYLGAFGSSAVWLGSATLEVVVATFLVWKADGIVMSSNDSGDWGVLTSTLASLLAVEVLALVAMWTAKLLWTRAKLLLLTEAHESPVRRDAGPS